MAENDIMPFTMVTATKEKRKFFRHPIQWPLTLRVLNTTRTVSSQARDISLGGLKFSWPKKISKGTLLDITIPVKEKFFDVKAKVVYSQEDRKTAHYFTGVSFVDFPSAFKARLAEEVLEILEYRKSISRQLGHEVSEEEAAKKWVHEFARDFGQT